ncbi:MAG: tetratricopeptide repeat protein [Pseudomonadota bacterium]
MSAAFVIAAACVLVYLPAMDGPFVLDDTVNIQRNPSVQPPGPWTEALHPPPMTSVSGRPVANLSLAANRRLLGPDPWGFRAVNAAIHAAAALVLFGLVLSVLSLPGSPRLPGVPPLALALAASLVFALHPIQTMAVTYVSQRCESLMGLFFLLTLALAVAGWKSRRPAPWHAGAVAAFLLGAGTKEVVVAAPVLVLAMDHVFNRPGRRLREMLRDSPVLYGGLALGLGVLVALVALGGSATSSQNDFAWYEYLAAQTRVIPFYLSQFLDPDRVCVNYSWPPASLAGSVVPGLVLAGLLAVSVVGTLRRNPAGFLGLSVFVILAPTSSFLPLREPAQIYRMYLPVAGLACLALGTLAWGAGRARRGRRAVLTVAGVAALAWIAFLGAATVNQNRSFVSERAVWEDTLNKAPDNPKALLGLGLVLAGENGLAGAEALFLRALAIRPVYPAVHLGLADVYARLGRSGQAREHFLLALDQDPLLPEANYNYGRFLLQDGQTKEAAARFQKAVAVRPWFVEARANLGVVLAMTGDLPGAQRELSLAVANAPDLIEARFNLGRVLLSLGRPDEAAREFARVLEANPGLAPARQYLDLAQKQISGRAGKP